MPAYHLTNFEIRNIMKMNLNLKAFNLEMTYLKQTMGHIFINLDEYKSIEAHLTALILNGDNVTCLNSFGVEHIPNRISYWFCVKR